MDLHVNWEAVLALIAVLGFFSGVIAFYVKLQFRILADELVKRLDERYVQRADCQLTHARLDMRLEG